MRRTIWLTPFLLLPVCAAQAQVVCPTLVGSTGTYDVDAMALDGDHVYLGSAGFKVLDVSDPNAPAEIGSNPSWSYGLAVSGDHVFSGGYDSGLQVFDVSDPNAPELVASCPSRGKALRLDVDGAYAYLTNDAMDPNEVSGLQVIDISDPLSPFEAGFLQAPVTDVEVEWPYAFAAVMNSGLWVIDISDPNDPNHVATALTGGQPLGVAVSGDYAYLATRWGGLRVVSIIDPLAPSEVGVSPTEDAIQVVIVGGVAYVADNFGMALRIIDVSVPTAPVEIGHYPTDTRMPMVVAGGGYAYIAADGGPFVVLDVDPVSGCPAPLFADGFESGDTSEWSEKKAW